MPVRLGVLVYPLFAFAMAMSQKGAASRFDQAGAISPQTARRPSSLHISNLDSVRHAARKGVLVAVGDGRYYVNQPVYRRRQRLIWTLLIAGGVVVVVLTALTYLPRRGAP